MSWRAALRSVKRSCHDWEQQQWVLQGLHCITSSGFVCVLSKAVTPTNPKVLVWITDGWGIYTRWLFLIYLQLMLWSWVVCFLSGRHRLREASAVSVSRERELEAEPERDTGPPAAALHHPFPVQQHAHQGKRHRTRVDEHRFTHTSG